MSYKDRKKRLEYCKQYYLCNSEKIKKCTKKYREEHAVIYKQKNRERYYRMKDEGIPRIIKPLTKEQKQKSSLRHKIYYKENKNRISLREKGYREKNKQKISERHRTWYQLNKEKINKKVIEDRGKSVQKRMKFGISALIRQKLKRHLFKKNHETTFKFLPYTVDDLIVCLEQKFKKGMSWNNYGKNGWHIDHKIPDCRFNYSSVNDSEFKKCWALDNLQPLWAEENYRKNRF